MVDMNISVPAELRMEYKSCVMIKKQEIFP